DLLDQGATTSTLLDAFDDDAPATAGEIVPQPGPTDDELDQIPIDPPLASPPLVLDGLPSFGPATARVTIVVLCSPLSDKCGAPDAVIDKLAAKLHVERQGFARCRASLAGRSVAFAAAARRSGVKTTPATVVGGRIYGPLVDWNTLQQLVDVELAPGWLGESA